ncbi:MAG TPA: UvrD-helicase domain-containing protein [Solirubrobacterales bacterium]|nr:UvrD-helicase domain-containing protein [Solirubrobacterales bacterium]
MSARTATPEQQAAIAAEQARVLVEAGAGTGKTGTMVDRYCRLVCDEDTAPDEVLAFTFTDRAAAELRERIRAQLQARADAGSERAQELLDRIGAAWVTTIHGFCNRLLAGHPVAAGIDPGFRVLDRAEASRIAAEAFDRALEDFLAAGEEDRERTVAAFGIAGLRAIVAGAHAELRSRGVTAPRLPQPPQPDVEAAMRHAAAAAAAALEELKPTNSARALLEEAIEVLTSGTGEPPDLDALAALRTGSRARPLAAYRVAIDAAVAGAAEAGEGGEGYRHVATLLELFSTYFEATKAQRAGLDFEDLQVIAARLLEGTELGAAYRERFSHILVDEFQDTNRLQLGLIEALRGPRCRLLAVGDELQSIYGFRHADLDVFREQRTAVGVDPDAAALELSGNFRSRPELIGAVNAIGERLLGDAYRPLRVGTVPGPEAANEEPAVELLLTGRDGWDREDIDLEPAIDARTAPHSLAEARFLAARLRELVDGGIERGRMVVLLRAFSNLDAYEDSLERAGLRPYVVGGRGYWSQQQVADVCALLATIANPLDDQALFGALASPACGVAPDTLWLLRAAAGRRRHVWPALERIGGHEEAELESAEALERIPAEERALLESFVETLAELRRRAARLPLAALIDASVAVTGYDLAVLMRPSGEARFANIRKLMRLAAEFEAREGHDLRGLLDFLAARSEADADAQAATALEGHDGVRIMTVHSAKGLEFDVVAVPDLARSPLAGSVTPLLALGREEPPRVGLQLRRLGAASVNLYAYGELREEGQRRDAEEELRLFHVAATRAREQLLLSGVIRAEPATDTTLRTPVIERIASAFDVDRERDSSFVVPPPEPRPGLEAGFAAPQVAVRVNLASPERAAELIERRVEPEATSDLGRGPAPLIERRPPTVPNRPLSYTAVGAFEECAYRFYMERVLDLPPSARTSMLQVQESASASEESGGIGPTAPAAAVERERGAARGAAVHSLLEWSQANAWQEPGEELVHSHALAAGLVSGERSAAAAEPDPSLVEELLDPVRAWLLAPLLRERVLATGAPTRAEVPLLLDVAGTVVRGSIDLLVEREGGPPLVVDYKTDRLGGATPAERARHYRTQRDVYGLAVAEALGVPEVEVAYVFLERPEEPVLATLGAEEMTAGRRRLEAAVERIAAGDFPPATRESRNWALCKGCPALGRLCSGPIDQGPSEAIEVTITPSGRA